MIKRLQILLELKKHMWSIVYCAISFITYAFEDWGGVECILDLGLKEKACVYLNCHHSVTPEIFIVTDVMVALIRTDDRSMYLIRVQDGCWEVAIVS